MRQSHTFVSARLGRGLYCQPFLKGVFSLFLFEAATNNSPSVALGRTPRGSEDFGYRFQ
jgi:hypothetical protein